MRELLEEARERRSVVKGLGAGFVGLVGFTGYRVDAANSERNEQARRHLGNACDKLTQNYELFSNRNLASLSGIYGLETDAVAQNLEEAKRERRLALEQEGFLGLESELQTELDEISIYLEVQETMQRMFAISGSVDGGVLYDEIIADTLADVVQQEELSLRDGESSVSTSEMPFQSSAFREALSAIMFSRGRLTDRLSHSVSDLLDLARDGLEILRGLDLLHKLLVVHLELPMLDQAILDIDHHLSQDRYRDNPRFTEALFDLKWYSTRIDSVRTLPDEIDGLTLGNHDITTSEIEKSAAAFQSAASIFEQSMNEWSEGNRNVSNELWSDGLTKILLASNESPFHR